MSSKSLKAEYQRWLWLLATADLAVVVLLTLPEVPGGELAEIANWRLITAVLIPVVVLLFVNVLPHKVKCMLVYWKRYGWLPGSEVFSKYAPDDARVDMTQLVRNIGSLPIQPREQNARWYQLYKLVEDQTEVAEAHKLFLMYRDMAVLSLAFALLGPSTLYIADASTFAIFATLGIYFVQFILTALSARWNGIRFVCNVAALHSAKKFNGTHLMQRES